jgi:hypothetical protein
MLSHLSGKKRTSANRVVNIWALSKTAKRKLTKNQGENNQEQMIMMFNNFKYSL